MQVGQILAAENGQGLTSVQRPRPKRQFTHFDGEGRSINLLGLLWSTAGLLRALMEEAGLSRSAGGVRAGSGPWQREQRRLGPGLARSLSVSCAPLLCPVQRAMANMADISNSCSSPLAPSGPAPSIARTAIPTQVRT